MKKTCERAKENDKEAKTDRHTENREKNAN